MAYTLHNGVATINLAALQKVDEGKSFGKHERQRPLQYPWGTKVSEHRWFPSQVYALRSSIDACIKDTAVQCIVVAAEGKFWCNGVDLLWVDQAPVSGAFIYIQYSVQPLHHLAVVLEGLQVCILSTLTHVLHVPIAVFCVTVHNCR